MKKTAQEKSSREYLLVVFSLFAGLFFFLLDSVGFIKWLDEAISFVVTPVVYEGDRVGGVGREYLETFVDIKKFREEYNQLKVVMYEKDVENAFYALLEEENDSLKKQIALGNEDQKYIMSKVLSDREYDFIRINKGEKSGVANGDVVVLGNMFVGVVANAGESSSLVRLATSRNSNFEAVVVRGGVEEARLSEDLDVLSKGVVVGSPDGIRIENMSMNANLQNGDVVVLNDAKVGEYLILGYLVGLSENPAATSRTGYVSPILDYDDLITVFVIGNF